MSTPTPGPWEVQDRRRAPLPNIRIKSGSHEVAQVSDVHMRDDHWHDWTHKEADAVDAEGLANARLIAAAPELRDALREILAITDRKHDAWDKARAALAKAEGTRDE